MKLQKVEIRNYRSIKSLDFVFEPRCRVLVGINESGKSNILNALAHLDPDIPASKKDVREPGRDEDAMPEGKILFKFRLDDSECDEICREMANHLQGFDPDGPKIASFKGVEYTLRQFAYARRDVLWRVKLNEEEKGAAVFSLDHQWTLIGKFGVPKALSKTAVTLPDGTAVFVRYGHFSMCRRHRNPCGRYVNRS
ncbi:AAA family ATPase [Brevifollis gellanilyticus]|uniref:Endonuclease GajA/Old nuclease/RecF-like AAA domain-containing protein n=1 Tax=Brevifollis gellanilyticus TaxID=748831 RepID=A0A512MF92_9BACT|nr:AAA family ATPase [Brevifollis gellanilyticus]GEP45414.1 hypothetical protein BGE01nite_47050 [Brevifollis gellanilyticus]